MAVVTCSCLGYHCRRRTTVSCSDYIFFSAFCFLDAVCNISTQQSFVVNTYVIDIFAVFSFDSHCRLVRKQQMDGHWTWTICWNIARKKSCQRKIRPEKIGFSKLTSFFPHAAGVMRVRRRQWEMKINITTLHSSKQSTALQQRFRWTDIFMSVEPFSTKSDNVKLKYCLSVLRLSRVSPY